MLQKLRRLSLLSLAVVLSMISGTSFADWSLDNTRSRLNFVSIKKSAVAEVHRFKRLEGMVAQNGQFELRILLGSVDTHVPVRDERMRKMLFDVSDFPLATVSGAVAPATIEKLSAGEVVDQNVEFTLSLHGKNQVLTSRVRIVKLPDEALLVTTLQPIILNASVFDLLSGIEALKTVAKLPSIATAVPVTFSLVFLAQPAGDPKRH